MIHHLHVTVKASTWRPVTAFLGFVLSGAVVLLTACSTGTMTPTAITSTTGNAQAPATSSGQSSTPGSTTVSVPVTATSMAALTLRPPSGFHWNRVAGAPGLETTTVDGGSISLLWMNPQSVKFRYVPGYTWPENGPASSADNRPSSWVPRMIAGFNGGFKLSDHVGGYYYRGVMVSPLRKNYAAFVVYRNGTMTVGVWGRDLHMNAQVLVVRQNLPPLVFRGHVRTSSSDDNQTWGLALQGKMHVNRSALGRRLDGSLIFAYGSLVTPSTMARYLVAAGVNEAMMLDMNRTWPTGFVYRHSHGNIHGTRINDNIYHSPSIYLTRNEKDFIAVEAP